MLEMRPNCECCGKKLPAFEANAMICSFECTFCQDCAQTLEQCPNCGGVLMPRPTRSSLLLLKHPASQKRIVKPQGQCQPSPEARAVVGVERLIQSLMRPFGQNR